MSPDQAAAPAPRHRALLIANWTFKKFDDLKGPPHDIRELKSALSDTRVGIFSPEDVVVVPDKSDHEVKDAIYEFVQPAQKNDVLLIYYSGHGVRVPAGNNFILATKETVPDRPAKRGVGTSFITGELNQSLAEKSILILDCCYAAAGFKGSPGLPELATDAYVLASSGTHEQTRDAKNHDEPSPFTKLLAECIRDTTIKPNQQNYVPIDSIWPKLLDLDPVPERRINKGGDVALARRGRISTGSTSGFDTLSLLTTPPDIVEIDVEMTMEQVKVGVPDSPGEPDEKDLALAESLRFTIRRLLELLDGAGRLEGTENEPWPEVCRRAWDGLGGTLLSAAIPQRLQEYLLSIDPAETSKLHKLRLRIQEGELEAFPWEALSAGTAKSEEYRHLGLNDGMLIERVLSLTRPSQSTNEASSVLFGVFAPLTSDRYRYVDQIVNQLSARQDAFLKEHEDLSDKQWYFDLTDKRCTWNGLVMADVWPSCLVLAFPLRRPWGRSLEVGFSGSDSEPDWQSATRFGDLLAQSRPYDCIVVENVASAEGFNSYRATTEFGRMLAEKVLSPVVYICHPASFEGYPMSSQGGVPTFSSELVLALKSGASIDLAVWHARRSVLLLSPQLRACFGFPGYYNPETPIRSRPRTSKPGHSVSAKLPIQQGAVGKPAKSDLHSAGQSDEKESDRRVGNGINSDGPSLNQADDAETNL